jgi:protein gp37
MENSKIEWCDATFNPWWGCVKVSDGCKNCYALTLSKRFGYDIWGPAKTTHRRMMSDNYWRQPLKWNAAAAKAGTRARVFCASMADVFEEHPEVEAPRLRLFELILDTPWLDWLLLTKRPENIKPMLQGMHVLKRDNVWDHLWPQRFQNVWLGTSVENQEQANKRIPELIKLPAAVHFLSCEPLLGAVDLSSWMVFEGQYEKAEWMLAKYGASQPLNWIIVGGESGHGARPMHPDWARSLRDQCQAAGVAVFVKQMGSVWAKSRYAPTKGTKGTEIGDFPVDLQIREMPL